MLKVKIQFAKLLDPFLIKACLVDYPEWQPPTREQVLNKVEVFKRVWVEKGGAILKQMTEITGLDFSREVIDVYIVSGCRNMSNPLIIKSRLNEKEFIEAMVEELLHNLFSRNKQGVDVFKQVKFKYPEHNDVVVNHTTVFYVMQKMGFELKFDDPDYQTAWEVAKSVDLF